MNAEDILGFWFEELTPSDWWKKDIELDALITTRFNETHNMASKLELYPFRETPRGRLAEIIVLDQFSRNIYRDKPKAFAQDGIALALAQNTVELGLDEKLSETERQFIYLPYMHSESLAIHQIALSLYERLGNEYSLQFEKRHLEIIERFGRYPHRNQILGRTSTEEELEFLKHPNSSF